MCRLARELLFSLPLSHSHCLLPCCRTSCCFPRHEPLLIFVLQWTTLVCVLQRAHQETAVWCWDGNIFMFLSNSLLKYLHLRAAVFQAQNWKRKISLSECSCGFIDLTLAFPFVPHPDWLLQLHQNSPAAEQHSSLRVWHLCFQPYLRLHRK